MAKKDNSTYDRKVTLRLNTLKALGVPAKIVETHGGNGRLYQRCYTTCPPGVVFELDDTRAGQLAIDRPTWAVYACRSEDALDQGVGFHHAPNFFDFDPHGASWPCFFAAVKHADRWDKGPVSFVVNDGDRQHVRLGRAWTSECFHDAIAVFGNHKMFDRYLDVCRWIVDRQVAKIGRRVTHWAGYYCGALKGMTHFAFVLSSV